MMNLRPSQKRVAKYEIAFGGIRIATLVSKFAEQEISLPMRL